jgi:hypothetical protein
MTISTQDCKVFLNSISLLIGESEKTTWKRTKKHKQDNLILRHFESSQGRTLIVAEKDSSLFLYSLSSVTSENDDFQPGYQKILHPVTENDAIEFMANCSKNDLSIFSVVEPLSDDPEEIQQTIEDASHPHNWYVICQFELDNEDLPSPLFYTSKTPISSKEIKKVYWLGLHDYDTAYRFYVFETHKNELYLGQNEPD